MTSSHHAGCPVPLRDLRYVRVSYVGFDGAPHEGELVVRRDVAGPVTHVFEVLYDARWPIERMRLVDAYGGNDDRSMAADNTSAYNCRGIPGTHAWSQHAYGTAIDLDPVQNPYVAAGSVAPPAGRAFAELDRSPGADVPPGVVTDDDVVVRAFASIGWSWGGSWTTINDYQHFEASQGSQHRGRQE